jgi:hypothetical protein
MASISGLLMRRIFGRVERENGRRRNHGQRSALVLNDCVRRKMFSVWSASKRLEVELEKDKLAKFHTLLSFWILRERGFAAAKQFLRA